MIKLSQGIHYTNQLPPDAAFVPHFNDGDVVYVCTWKDDFIKAKVFDSDYKDYNWRYTIHTETFQEHKLTIADGDIWVVYDLAEFNNHIDQMVVI